MGRSEESSEQILPSTSQDIRLPRVTVDELNGIAFLLQVTPSGNKIFDDGRGDLPRSARPSEASPCRLDGFPADSRCIILSTLMTCVV